jgi:hypothetical protein
MTFRKDAARKNILNSCATRERENLTNCKFTGETRNSDYTI